MSRYAVFFLVTGAVLGVFSGFGLRERAVESTATFLREWEAAKEAGVDVLASLDGPSPNIGLGQNAEIVDPLRYLYDAAANAVGMLNIGGFIANWVQFSSIILVPIAGVLVGAMLSTKDYRYHTIGVRAIRSPVWVIMCAYLVGGIGTCFLLILSGSVSAVVTGLALVAFASPEVPELLQQVPVTISAGGLSGWIAFSVLVSVAYSVLGVVFGMVLRSVVIGTVIFSIYHLAVPIVYQWDPRNLFLLWVTQDSILRVCWCLARRRRILTGREA